MRLTVAAAVKNFQSVSAIWILQSTDEKPTIPSTG